ncbi:MAG: FAD-dependent oxidoreductase [Burkholderiales bacterium]|nr:FAD-dependent oxidoreductase [Burkholderiales bacterium]
MPVTVDDAICFDFAAPVVIVGAGACGLVAALAARDAGAEVLVIERDASPSGSTALSSGFVPAAGTRYQRAAGIDDAPERMAADIRRKNHDEADPRVVEAVCRASGPAIEWLADAHGVPFVLVEGFLYPGHTVARMHAVPEKTGAALMAALLRAASAAGVDLLCSARVIDLVATSGRRVTGVRIERPDGTREEAGCGALVLACSGFGGNRAMVREHIPEIADALYFGHAGNQGDAVRWGAALGAAVRDMGAYQGHGSVATPHGVLVTWALMMEGGIQVNAAGERFSDEHQGYSEQCLPVLEQPGGFAWNVYDARLHRLGMAFEDYRQAVAAGAIRSAPDAATLAVAIGVSAERLAHTLAEVAGFAAGQGRDRFGRDFTGKPALAPPYYAVKVTGALFHTQGGLAIDTNARVLDARESPLPNLFAGGGAACGVSGAHVWGYLSGNGLLTAVTLGRLAGQAAAATAQLAPPDHP